MYKHASVCMSVWVCACFSGIFSQFLSKGILGLEQGWRCHPGARDLADCLVDSIVLKLLKMAVGMRALLDTVMQALPQVPGKWGALGRWRGALKGQGSQKLVGRTTAPLPSLFLFSRWGTWGCSSCCYFSSLQLWAWSSLETWVSRGRGWGAHRARTKNQGLWS